MKVINVTRKVHFTNPRGDMLTITKCICGSNPNRPGFIIGVDRGSPTPCPDCGRRFYWAGNVQVYRVIP